MEQNVKIGVIGGGSWATALVKILCENLNKLHWYMRNTNAIEHIKKEGNNPNYLSAVNFNTDKLLLTSSINELVSTADWLIFAIPSAFLETELEKLTIPLNKKIIFSAIKGIVPESGLIVGEHFNRNYDIPFENIGVITGPCHAEEVALERLSYLTLACANTKKAEQLASLMQSHYIRTKISDDIIGTEYAAMLKNIYAIAAGIAHGLGYGDNFQSVLMSNAIREMKSFIDGIYKMKRDINNSAYLGDLLVTGYSTFSRNRMFGNMIGKGYTVKSAMMEMNMVAEGYYAAKSAHLLMEKLEIKSKTPIINAVYQILYKNKDSKVTFKKLTDKLD
jgi:glycerol-3-phosphate dehydrogenase (NAD(P)+)